jgi:hypothetical protein
MVAAIPYGQFVGGLVGGCLWLFFAVWAFSMWPHSIRRKIALGKLDEAEGAAKLKKAPVLAFSFIIIAVCDIVVTLMQADYFGDSIFPSLIMCGLVIAFLTYLIVAKRRTNS